MDCPRTPRHADSEAAEDEVDFKLRSYQEEMLEASLHRNVVVAMDTGSGKTHIAIARIRAELESSASSGKLVWFIAPSVALCEQHFARLPRLLSAYQVKLLVGTDKLDKWTDQWHWDTILANVDIVIGTPKVLEEALEHGFVSLAKMSLLVFDEAHHCTGDHPMAGIMKNFYAMTPSRPHILGLTASPVFGAKPDSLVSIEATLDSRVLTPKYHRSELEKFVHPPHMMPIVFEPLEEVTMGPICKAVLESFIGYDIRNDPYVVQLIEAKPASGSKELSNVMSKQKTYCKDQLRALTTRAQTIISQIGPLSAERYLESCIRTFLESNRSQSSLVVMPEMSDKEKTHLASILRSALEQGDSQTVFDPGDSLRLSAKTQRLVELLRESASPQFNGIIFVEQRAVAIAMVDVLNHHYQLRDMFRTGTFLGTSKSDKRKSNLADLSDIKRQQADLDGFRQGEKNLMVATNVLEEGIDVSACNAVISFDLPANLVSFVQRRGRARQEDSKYIMFVPKNDKRVDPTKWQVLEEKMKESYMNDERQLKAMGIETEDDVAADKVRLAKKEHRLDATGALLTTNNAKAHLFHFCQTGLEASRYVDIRPEFKPHKDDITELWTAEVFLPIYVHASVRTARGTGSWRTERAAVLDAAFEAYLALYHAGLVNNHFLPLLHDRMVPASQHRDQPRLMQVAERKVSWVAVATGRASAASLHPNLVKLSLDGEQVACLAMWLPDEIRVPQMTPFDLYWNEGTTYEVSFEAPGTAIKCDVSVLRSYTHFLLSSVHGSRMTAKDHFVMLFSPRCLANPAPWQLGYAIGRQKTHWDKLDKSSQIDGTLVNLRGQTHAAYILPQGNASGDEIMADAHDVGSQSSGLEVFVSKFPKRKDFLHPVPFGNDAGRTSRSRLQAFPASDCVPSLLPLRYAIFAAFIPSIMHCLDKSLLVDDLCTTILEPIAFTDRSLVMAAISSPQANEGDDYNRLEYIGDHILKFCTGLQIMAQHPMWPEAYLSVEKDRIVRNTNLAQAAIEAGLDAYILTKPFTGAKWQPPYVDEAPPAKNDKKREISSKILADVVEALIGAAFVDGGLAKAYQCIKTLLPQETWDDQAQSIASLSAEALSSRAVSLPKLEEIIGHKFANPCLLLEAVTHASSQSKSGSTSYERLEFLGDAILDLIITPKLFAHPRKLKHWQLHHVHEALVNSHVLGFACMQHSIEVENFDVVPSAMSITDLANLDLKVERSAKKLHMHDFLHCGHELLHHKQACLDSYAKHRAAIIQALASSTEYPWLDLITLSPRKFFSDLVESILGAIYIDTAGDLSVCEAFIEKLGLFDWMQRFLDEDVQTTHPKELLGVVADRDAVGYVNSVVSIAEGEANMCACSIKVGTEILATVDGCGSREEAEARAASRAIEVLRVRMKVAGAKRKRDLDDMVDEVGAGAGAGSEESASTEDEIMSDA